MGRRIPVSWPVGALVSIAAASLRVGSGEEGVASAKGVREGSVDWRRLREEGRRRSWLRRAGLVVVWVLDEAVVSPAERQLRVARLHDGAAFAREEERMAEHGESSRRAWRWKRSREVDAGGRRGRGRGLVGGGPLLPPTSCYYRIRCHAPMIPAALAPVCPCSGQHCRLRYGRGGKPLVAAPGQASSRLGWFASPYCRCQPIFLKQLGICKIRDEAFCSRNILWIQGSSGY